MSGIDYDLTKIKAFVFDVDGVLSPSTIPIGNDGVPIRMANIKDGYALQLAVKLGYKIAIITGGNTESVRERYNALGIEDVYLGADRKFQVLTEWMARKGLTPEEVSYMGDDIPDIPALRHVGLPTAPYDAATEVRQTASYVSKFTGGYGCARDLIEQTLKANDKWLGDERAFRW